jgi:hypothetical protein
LGLRRFRVSGRAKVRAEATWAALTYNLQQWIRLRWRPIALSAATGCEIERGGGLTCSGKPTLITGPERSSSLNYLFRHLQATL